MKKDNVKQEQLDLDLDSLEEYEEICPKCNGRGFIGKKPNNIIGYGSNWCSYCRGTGFLDWIDKIKGKKY